MPVKKDIPMEVVLDDGSVSLNISDVLHKWQNEFRSLFATTYQTVEFSSENVQTNFEKSSTAVLLKHIIFIMAIFLFWK